MSTVVGFPTRRIPRDTFPIRIAVIRTEMGWNYDQAASATGINSETWRLWEKGKRRCADIESASRAISSATGYSYEWLMVGGPLDAGGPDGGPAMSRCTEPLVLILPIGRTNRPPVRPLLRAS